MIATTWMEAAKYAVFLYPNVSMRRSAIKQPQILPVHGREFSRAFLVAGRLDCPDESWTPNWLRKDGSAWRDPNDPVSLEAPSAAVHGVLCPLGCSDRIINLHAEQESTL